MSRIDDYEPAPLVHDESPESTPLETSEASLPSAVDDRATSNDYGGTQTLPATRDPEPISTSSSATAAQNGPAVVKAKLPSSPVKQANAVSSPSTADSPSSPRQEPAETTSPTKHLETGPMTDSALNKQSSSEDTFTPPTGSASPGSVEQAAVQQNGAEAAQPDLAAKPKAAGADVETSGVEPETGATPVKPAIAESDDVAESAGSPLASETSSVAPTGPAVATQIKRKKKKKKGKRK